MLVKWDPFSEMTALQRNINRLFTDTMMGGEREGVDTTPALWTRRWAPAVDITESENEIVVEAEIPGMVQDDIDVNIEDNQLTIKGEKKTVDKKEGENFVRREMSYGSFYRAFTLATPIKEDDVEAKYKNWCSENSSA